MILMIRSYITTWKTTTRSRAEKDGKIFLVQVAYSVAEEKAYTGEFAAFANIDNTVRRY